MAWSGARDVSERHVLHSRDGWSAEEPNTNTGLDASSPAGCTKSCSEEELLSGSPRDRHDVGVARCPLCLQSLALPGGEALGVKTRQHRFGDEHLVRLGSIADARGDVHVHAEIVAAEPARAAPVHARTHV